jgi:Stage II sporulation protein E (SpoIIE)
LPILIREGQAETVGLTPGFPFGVASDAEYHVQELQLDVGDRLVFLTDGILERNAADVNAMEIIGQTRHLHPREAMQALTRAVVEACGGVLRDDATTGTAAGQKSATRAPEPIAERVTSLHDRAAAVFQCHGYRDKRRHVETLCGVERLIRLPRVFRPSAPLTIPRGGPAALAR